MRDTGKCKLVGSRNHQQVYPLPFLYRRHRRRIIQALNRATKGKALPSVPATSTSTFTPIVTISGFREGPSANRGSESEGVSPGSSHSVSPNAVPEHWGNSEYFLPLALLCQFWHFCLYYLENPFAMMMGVANLYTMRSNEIPFLVFCVCINLSFHSHVQ